MRTVFICVFVGLLLTGCGSLRLKDFNKVDIGMSKAKVIDILGEPTTTKTIDNREVLEYEAKDADGDKRPRWVVLEDKEVVYFGRPGEYKSKAELKASEGSSIGGITVSPTVSPTISPVFNNQTGTPIDKATLYNNQYSGGETKKWVHDPIKEAGHE